MDWCVAIRRIEIYSSALRGGGETFGADLKALLGFLDHADVMVAYAAKEELRKVLIGGRIVETRCVNDVVNAILLVPSTAWRGEASGFRFQLLRQLVRMKDGGESVGDGSEDGSTGDEPLVVEYSYLQAVLKNSLQLRAMVRSVFIPTGRSEGDDTCSMTAATPHSVQYETLVFLSDFMKRVDTLRIKLDSQVALSELMAVLMDEVFVTMDYTSQPTFVSCAVLGLLGDFQKLVKSWKEKTQTHEEHTLEAVYSKWFERCLVWLMQSSCTATALRLLNCTQSSTVASQESFVGKSSRYPFLQQWILYLSRMGVAIIEASLTKTKSSDWKPLEALTLAEGPWAHLQLPGRKQLFAVLAEQDDVMIEVLNGLTRMAALAEGANNFPNLLAQWFTPVTAHITAEYDPDLLFADLVDTLGRDHLVLLDLLVSNETQMLGYFMRYLRYLSAHWGASKRKLQVDERLEGVMNVFIRLRMEIDRLVAASLFPYGAEPLTRRLLVIEQLYEEPGDDDARQL
ncbi:hypothetical protein PHYPSEUDO_011211 [Phytophthora pseudosyringae]|uniref:Protein Lines N-terminal domain-containing protein n=1 Tax=Phytophthora pseudosyringae TaxID=221518 RepID=A0A8T1WIH9_9STRA|nr:hypothetical protein PHYPSEUDO_011211 [Phytophthora pseudosyringae]